MGFAPAHDPKIAIAAIVEFGHPDNTISLAVPFASALVDRYLETLGLPAENRVAGGAAVTPAAETGE